MRDSDSKSLEALYESVRLIKEDEAGRPIPYYGSDAASGSTAVMGTEPLTVAEIELPKKAGKESVPDDEDQVTETDLQKLLDKVRQTINDYEDKKQLRFNKELEESTLNEAGFLAALGNAASTVGKAAGNVAKGVGNAVGEFGAAVQSGDPVKYAIDKAKTFAKNKSSEKYVGYEEGQIIPVVGHIVQYAASDIFGRITSVNPKQKQYTIRFISYSLVKTTPPDPENPKFQEDSKPKYGIRRTKFRGAYGGFEIDETSKGATIPTYIVGKGSAYNQWVDVSVKGKLNAALKMLHQGDTSPKPTEPTDGETITLPSGINKYDAKTKTWLLPSGKPNPASGLVMNAWKKSKGIP